MVEEVELEFIIVSVDWFKVVMIVLVLLIVLNVFCS